jgi:transcriptional regulator with XRE-family HTH domain
MNLKDWRKSKGWGQADLADKIGSNQKTYSAYETGRLKDIPPEIQARLRKLGYAGPWPKDEGLEEAPAGGPYVTEAQLAEWRGYWRAGMESVLSRVDALEDQVRKLRQQAGLE